MKFYRKVRGCFPFIYQMSIIIVHFFDAQLLTIRFIVHFIFYTGFVINTVILLSECQKEFYIILGKDEVSVRTY